uniref:SHSP domain-containing protein n=1 Tax=Romanomermis culicivorax TaxID=13658 RepID=A0A915JWS6_ROMCU
MWKVKVEETKVIIEAAMKKKVNEGEKDNEDQVDETLTYEHALPGKVDPKSVKCEYPADGTVRVTGKCGSK